MLLQLLQAMPAGRLLTLAIVCSSLDAGQTDVVIDRHHRPIADFRDSERQPVNKMKEK